MSDMTKRVQENEQKVFATTIPDTSVRKFRKKYCPVFSIVGPMSDARPFFPQGNTDIRKK